MKTMSKFFLIVSGALALIGGLLMIIGSVMAKSAGVQLFQQKVDGKYKYTVDLTENDVAKISIDATDTDINVITGEENEYIEFINFNENYYSISTTNKVVRFEENVSLKSLVSFWDGSFTFKGMRSFLTLGRSVDGQKEINIHLKDISGINIFNFTITDGDITIKNASGSADYIITLDSGKVVMDNVTTDSKVMVNGNDCTIDFKDCSFKYFASDIAVVDMKAAVSGLHSFELTGKTGTIDADIGLDAEEKDVRISSKFPFTYNGEEKNGEFANNDKTVNVTEEFAIVHISGDEVKMKVNVKAPAAETETEKTSSEE